jgi:serine/threonine protein kinase
LEPDPNKRFSFKELISLLEGKNIQAFNVEPKFERDYTITKKISTSFLTELQKYDKEISTIGFFDLNALNNNEIVSLYLVEHKGTMKRCNAFCNTFLNEKDAYRFYERSLEIFNNLRHENLVSIRDIYFQKNEYGHYQVFTVKERYHDNLNGFLQSRIENGHYLSKKMLFSFASQLLEALQHLHSKQYIHAPGEINALHVYFNQMYDELFLDIGRSPSFITAHWITQNSQSIAMNPFVSPEFKEYVVSFCHSNNSEMTYQYSEKDDVYSFGILLFMMTTLLLEPEIISGSLMVQKTKMLQEHIAEQIDALNSTANSLSDIISIIAKAVDPNPANRATLKELAAILKTNPPTVQVLQPLQKFEEEYIIIKKVIGRETAKKNGNGNTTEKVSTFLVEQRKTFNRFYATRVVFQDYLSALQYRNSKWKEAVDLQHKNIVPIYNVFLQNNNSEQYQVIVVKERCQESLIEFIEFRKESNENLDEDLVLGFASQLLSALQLLHSKHYCYSPGELNPSHIYLNETRDEILLDVGSSSPSITSEYLLQHAQELSLNPFVSPECKQFIASLLQEKSKSMNYVISEKDDVYNVGVLVYMMITLNSDTKFISDSLIVPSSQTFEKFMMEHIESMNANYSPKLSGLLIKTLNPNARKRFGIDSLSKLLLTRSVVGKSLSPTDEKLGSKFEDRYTIVNTINTLALNNSQELEKNKRNSMQLLSVDNNICTNYRDALSLFEVEHKETLKKYIALCASFRNEKDAIQYYDSFKQKYILKHDNLIPIVKMCIQKSNMYQFQVYILKEVYRNNFVDCIDNRRKNNAYFTEDTIIDYSSQLLSLVDYLHFNEYIHAPGEICSKNLYFSETHNDLLLDIGKNSNIPVDWIMHNSQSLLQNPFLAPEYKPFFISRSRWSRRSQTLKCTKKADVYCVGVLIYMLITLTSDLSTIYNALEVPKGMTFDNHIKSLVESVPVSIKYSEKLVHLLQMALRPTPTSRLEASELRKML